METKPEEEEVETKPDEPKSSAPVIPPAPAGRGRGKASPPAPPAPRPRGPAKAPNAMGAAFKKGLMKKHDHHFKSLIKIKEGTTIKKELAKRHDKWDKSQPELNL